MLLKLIGKSIKYASNDKRKQNFLKADIDKLESESDNASNILELKKMEIKERRNERMKGQWEYALSGTLRVKTIEIFLLIRNKKLPKQNY